jgi:hypothetical protein
MEQFTRIASAVLLGCILTLAVAGTFYTVRIMLG